MRTAGRLIALYAFAFLLATSGSAALAGNEQKISGSEISGGNASVASLTTTGYFVPAKYTFATLPSTAATGAVIGNVVYCSNCRIITSTTSNGIAGGTTTKVQEAAGAGSGDLVIWKTYPYTGGTTGWFLASDPSVAAAA